MKEASFSGLRCTAPSAYAIIQGSPEHPALYGVIQFCERPQAILVQISVEGLPHTAGACSGRFFGLHLHSGPSCTGTAQEPFADADSHYNPMKCPHPFHAGDFPPLLGCRDIAWSTFLTDRIRIDEVIGRTVILHEHPDDFHTQPSGNAGTMIGCGVIRRVG